MMTDMDRYRDFMRGAAAWRRRTRKFRAKGLAKEADAAQDLTERNYRGALWFKRRFLAEGGEG